jgi:hypothetical protein
MTLMEENAHQKRCSYCRSATGKPVLLSGCCLYGVVVDNARAGRRVIVTQGGGIPCLRHPVLGAMANALRVGDQLLFEGCRLRARGACHRRGRAPGLASPQLRPFVNFPLATVARLVRSPRSAF